ncbi:hypothetical protein JVU11DRAFT_5535 [Chiua virens]|nr:hypothetical protein JVU11DRAFT_5535 [Chiua virens]
MPPHLSTIDFTPPTIRVADRCWCDFASGLFEPYDVQKWERDSIQRAVAQIEKQWKQSLEPENTNITSSTGPPPIEIQEATTTLNFTIENDTLFTLFRSFLSRRSYKLQPSPSPSPSPAILADATTLPASEISIEHPVIPPAILAEPPLAPGQLDMRPLGFELVLDLRWSRKS